MNDITKLMVRTAYDALDEKLGQDIEIIDIQNIGQWKQHEPDQCHG